MKELEFPQENRWESGQNDKIGVTYYGEVFIPKQLLRRKPVRSRLIGRDDGVINRIRDSSRATELRIVGTNPYFPDEDASDECRLGPLRFTFAAMAAEARSACRSLVLHELMDFGQTEGFIVPPWEGLFETPLPGGCPRPSSSSLRSLKGPFLQSPPLVELKEEVNQKRFTAFKALDKFALGIGEHWKQVALKVPAMKKLHENSMVANDEKLGFLWSEAAEAVENQVENAACVLDAVSEFNSFCAKK